MFRVLRALLSIGMVLLGLGLVWWFTLALTNSGGPDVNRSLWVYAPPYLVGAGLALGGTLSLIYLFARGMIFWSSVAVVLFTVFAALWPLVRPYPTPALTPEEARWVEQSRARAYVKLEGLWLRAPRLVVEAVEVRPYGRRVVFAGYGLFAWCPRWQVIMRLQKTENGGFYPSGGGIAPYGAEIREPSLK